MVTVLLRLKQEKRIGRKRAQLDKGGRGMFLFYVFLIKKLIYSYGFLAQISRISYGFHLIWLIQGFE